MVGAERRGSPCFAYAQMVPAVVSTYALNCVALPVVMKWEWRYIAILGFLKFLSLLVSVL